MYSRHMEPGYFHAYCNVEILTASDSRSLNCSKELYSSGSPYSFKASGPSAASCLLLLMLQLEHWLMLVSQCSGCLCYFLGRLLVFFCYFEAL